MKLDRKQVEKPWGRTELPPPFSATYGKRIGEIWFADPDGRDLPLLVKYIFTSERLSIQVHPNDEEARERGLPRGKTECWYILDADPGATLGLGLTRELGGEELRSAALDGSIEELMDWKPVKAGDFFFVPAGTVHAIGGGISLIEIQQNSDVTYRLYDYGRPRELHLDDGVEVSKAAPYHVEGAGPVAGGTRTLVEGPHFTLVHADGPGAAEVLAGRDRWVVPVRGEVRSVGESAQAGECLLVGGDAPLEITEGAAALVASPGGGE
jgi:mannose-6-phosphate isomerase